MKALLYTQSGEKKGEVALSAALFGAKINPGLMHEAMLMQLNNARTDTASTLTKGEVRGGGRKPYRQKGTGRARQGSIRNPHYKGGGVAFGPRGNRNYSVMMPKKQRRAALFSALSVKAQENGILVLDKYEAKIPKTKDFVALLKKLPLQRKILIVLPGADSTFQKSARNVPNVRILTTAYLNIVDLLWAENVLFLESALRKAEEIFLKS